ncbi:hypothetical protein DLAC_10519 [Tieghemostelium lacteum]|uniref:Uncharacterized protein n=1 Tax=Tieghemostelium lacteum TaxID=361077 RepID=A0A151Z4Q5_TIELA|nr:hypothetical protein DLAC_10519 [Tieghemostelium lacteum]|eukprot:KYQ88936.1 hypothetical protein DLAC_10519 [Tieghemostelium lacteum]
MISKILKKKIIQLVIDSFKDEKSISFYQYLIGTFSLVSKEFYQLLEQIEFNEILFDYTAEKQLEYIKYLINRGLRVNFLPSIIVLRQSVKTILPIIPKLIEIFEIQYYNTHKTRKEIIVGYDINKDNDYLYEWVVALLSNFYRDLEISVSSLSALDNYKNLNLELESSKRISKLCFCPTPHPTIDQVFKYMENYQLEKLSLQNDNTTQYFLLKPLSPPLKYLKNLTIKTNQLSYNEYDSLLKYNQQLKTWSITVKKFYAVPRESVQSVLIDSLIHHPTLQKVSIRIPFNDSFEQLVKYLNTNSKVQSFKYPMVRFNIPLKKNTNDNDKYTIYNNTLEFIEGFAMFDALKWWGNKSNLQKLSCDTTQSVDLKNHLNLTDLDIYFEGNSQNIYDNISRLNLVQKLHLHSPEVYLTPILNNMIYLKELVIISKSSITIDNIHSIVASNHQSLTKLTLHIENIYVEKITTSLCSNSTILHLTINTNEKSPFEQFIRLLYNKPNLKYLEFNKLVKDNTPESSKIYSEMSKYYKNNVNALLPSNWKYYFTDSWLVYKNLNK